MNQRFGILKLAVILLAVMAWGCFKTQDIKIGVIVPQAGSLGDYGFQIISGIELAEEHLRAQYAAGEIGMRFKTIIKNESEDPAEVNEAIRSFKELEEAGVTAVIGGASSSATLALAPLANASEIILLSPASSSPEINKGNGDYVFRNYPSDTLEAQAISNVIFQRILLQRVLVVRAKSAYAEGISYEVLRFARSFSRDMPDKVVKFDPDPAAVDFAAVADEIVEQKPQAVFMAAYTDSLIPLIKEIRSRPELEKTILFASSSLLLDKAVRALGPEPLQDVIFANYPWDVNSDDTTVQTFVSDFESKYHTTPTIYAATGYDAMMVLAKAINATKHVLGSEIRAELNKTNHDGVLGETDFNKRGDVTRIPLIYWVKNGEQVVMTTEDMEAMKIAILGDVSASPEEEE